MELRFAQCLALWDQCGTSYHLNMQRRRHASHDGGGKKPEKLINLTSPIVHLSQRSAVPSKDAIPIASMLAESASSRDITTNIGKALHLLRLSGLNASNPSTRQPKGRARRMRGRASGAWSN